MKRILAVLVAAAVCLGCAGCKAFDGFDYMKAMKLYEAADYENALPIFSELGDYADSQAMAARCKQFVDYADAEAYFSAGDYRQALPLYESLLLYEDSPVKAVQCRYALGAECTAAENYEEAVSWYESLGGYEDASQKCREARWLWLWQKLDRDGPAEQTINENGDTVFLSALEDHSLEVTYLSEGSLLGMPYEYKMEIRFDLTDSPAQFALSCKSYAASTILEEASGSFEKGGFTGSSMIELASFTQTVTMENQEDAPVSQNQDPAQAVLIHGTVAAAQGAVAEHLSELLEQTGVAITAADLGFLSL